MNTIKNSEIYIYIYTKCPVFKSVFIFKVLLIYTLMEYSKLSKGEKQNIFEIVNSTNLKLKGDEKKALKRQFMSWKINKTIGAFELFMKLYESEELYDSKNEWFQELINNDTFLEDECNGKYISRAKYERNMRYSAEEREELEQQLEEVENEKGYITEESHKQQMEQLKKEHFQEKRQLGDQIIKYRNQVESAQIKLESERKITDILKIQYEKQLKGLKENLQMDSC